MNVTAQIFDYKEKKNRNLLYAAHLAYGVATPSHPFERKWIWDCIVG